MPDSTKPIRLAVLISGGGRTLMNLHQRIRSGHLNATIQVVVSSCASARGVERARDARLDTVVLDRESLTPTAFQDGITEAIAGADLVCMGGFLFLWRVPVDRLGRVLNIHPALLPEFGGEGMYGHRVHEAVLAARKTESGCTVHLCDNEYDHGPIVLQRRVPVLAGDTPDALAARVFREECVAYPEAIRLFAEDRIRVSDGRVVIRDSHTRDDV